MLIISRKKDYYDGVAGTTGIDKTIVYDRKIIEYEGKDERIPEIFNKSNKYSGNIEKNKDTIFHSLNSFDIKNEIYFEQNTFIIGFCGKIYVGQRLFKNPDEFDITYDQGFVKSIITRYSWGWDNGVNYIDVINKIKSTDYTDLFREFNTPIFLFDYGYNKWSYKKPSITRKFIINPILKEYEFYKVFDSYQAFQEIQMFLGGVLGTNEKNIVEIDDKYKIEQHGFDKKWSFRKEPQKKK